RRESEAASVNVRDETDAGERAEETEQRWLVNAGDRRELGGVAGPGREPLRDFEPHRGGPELGDAVAPRALPGAMRQRGVGVRAHRLPFASNIQSDSSARAWSSSLFDIARVWCCAKRKIVGASSRISRCSCA